MAEVVSEESEDDPDLEEQFTFGKWTGPKFIFKQVHKWAVKDTNCDERTIGNFLQYCWGFCENDDEEDEMFEWMLSLITRYVREDGWKGFCEGALIRDWSQVTVRNGWEIPTPEWAKSREAEDIMNGMGKVDVNEEVVVKDELKNCELKKGEVKEDVKKEVLMTEVEMKGVLMKEEEEVKKVVSKKDEVREVVVKENMKKVEVLKVDVKEVVTMMKEALVKKEEMEENDVESFEETTGELASPWSTWGSQLRPPSPPIPVPLQAWRPWEQRQKS